MNELEPIIVEAFERRARRYRRIDVGQPKGVVNGNARAVAPTELVQDQAPLVFILTAQAWHPLGPTGGAGGVADHAGVRRARRDWRERRRGRIGLCGGEDVGQV